MLAGALRKLHLWPIALPCRPRLRAFAALITTEFCQTRNHRNRNGMYRRNGGAMEALHLA